MINARLRGRSVGAPLCKSSIFLGEDGWRSVEWRVKLEVRPPGAPTIGLKRGGWVGSRHDAKVDVVHSPLYPSELCMALRAKKPDGLQGTLDLLLLKMLSREPQHGLWSRGPAFNRSPTIR